MAESVDDIGFHLLDAQNELAGPGSRSKHTAIRLVAAGDFGPLRGALRTGAGVFFNLRRDNGRLLAQLTGQYLPGNLPRIRNRIFLQGG